MNHEVTGFSLDPQIPKSLAPYSELVNFVIIELTLDELHPKVIIDRNFTQSDQKFPKRLNQNSEKESRDLLV
ncbi:hypothetical protein [Xenococcus sp. PCC 7305]|uniref:hypothetical protein n=1 Tax=Xenococcus sp. PCC 7305 TaxID=102125 RepID=UPI0002EF689D|nr:hypothetical protein [Xenococcus sp. PCC 7305]